MKKLLLFIFALISPQLFAQWQQAPNPENVRLGEGGYAVVGDTVFTGTSLTSGFDGDLEALYKSGDQGLTWIKVNAKSGLTNQNIDFLSVVNVDSLLFLASVRYLQSSNDGGMNWEINGDFQQGDEHVPVHFVQQGNVIVGAAQGDTNDGADGIFRKVGDGDWEPANEGLPEGRDDEIAPQIFDMIISDERIILTASQDVYFSDDTAKTWTRFTGFGTYISQLSAGNDMLLGAGFRSFNAYLYKSLDNGSSWERLNLPTEMRTGIENLFFADGIFYASVGGSNVDEAGVYISEDGENWNLLGLKGSRVRSISNTADNMLFEVFLSYQADSLRGTWIYPKSEVMVTSNETAELPLAFNLYQNYPNPFNPSTTIRYSLDQPGEVQLTVYNSIGKEISRLEQGYKTSGSHNYTFNASNLASGIYYYRLEAAGNVQTRKMLLIK